MEEVDDIEAVDASTTEARAFASARLCPRHSLKPPHGCTGFYRIIDRWK